MRYSGHVQLYQAIATRTFGPGQTTWRRLFSPRLKRCAGDNVLDVAGTYYTGPNGTARFRLSDFLCESYLYSAPVNVVATPWTTSPAFLTLRHSIVQNAEDVEIDVSTWSPVGDPAPEIVFDWRCRAAVFVPIE